jgi:general stress protein 26
MDDKKTILEFLKTVNHAVIGTVNKNGNPQGATVGFGQTEELEIIFGTSSLTQKAQNISQNNHVSLVVNDPTRSVQYEGTARLLDGVEKEMYTKIYFEKNPGMAKYYELESQQYYLVTPHWIRYIDHTKSPNGTIEIRF